MAAEEENMCSKGCQQKSPLSGQECCPKDCELCKKKNCSTKDECQCNICTCGCQGEEYKDKPCNESLCATCKVICEKVQKGERCRCTFCDCGCQEAFKLGKLCYESQDNKKCNDCTKKCKNSKDGTCICKLCSCGCDGVNCQCCKWCNPETNCTGKCDSVEKHDKKTCPKGMCEQNGGTCLKAECICIDNKLDGHYKGTCVCKCRCEQKCPRILCSKNSGRKCRNALTEEVDCKCKCTCTCNAIGDFYDDKGTKVGVGTRNAIYTYVAGKCRFKCTNCGRLCDQDRCMIWIRVIVIGLIILASLFVLRAIFPEKFRAIMTKIRATFASAPVHSGRSPNNLFGDRIPEEMNVYRYPGFRPRPYAGLS